MSTADVVVIGAGVIGASVAYELARDGHRVVAVDRGPGPGCGSTSASSAIVRFNYSTYVGVAAAWESKQLWQDWAGHLEGSDETGDARFIQVGGLSLDFPGQAAQKVHGLFDAVGVPYELWDANTIRTRLGALSPERHYPPKRPDDEAFWADPDGELGGLWMPDAGFIDDPQQAAHNLVAAAGRRGATFRFRTTVTGIATGDGRVRGVELSDGSRIDAPVVINVAGPHSGIVNEMAGVLEDFTVTTRPLRQEVHHVAAPAGWGELGPFVNDGDLGAYFRGTPGGGLLLGGTEPECDPLHWLDDPDSFDPNPTQDVYRPQVYRVARRLPELAVPDAARGIAGVYDVSTDWIPIYDRTALPGFYVAIGTSGNQFKNAPVVGRFLAELIAAVEGGHDHDADPVRVKLERTGRVADLGHYSRRREIDPDGNFNVMA